MGTTPPEKETPRGVIQRIGHTATVITEEAADTTFAGHGRSGSIYALILCLVLGLALASASSAIALVLGIPVLVLLAVWIGARR